MNVILLGEADAQLPLRIAAKLEAHRHRAIVASPDAHLERETREADAVVDCWVTDAAAKLAALGRYERWLRRDAAYLTCCHAASATRMAAGAGKAPGRVVGFALPAPIDDRKLVECALPLQATGAAKPAAEALWRAIGLEAVWVDDSVGLIMPRILAGLANEAFFALGEGLASARDIDRAMQLGTRYPRGPLAWAELMGLDQVLACLDALATEHGEDRYRAAPLLRRRVAAGRTGRLDALHPDEVETA